MALELNVSKINNTVTFNVDKVSMRAAKDSIKEIEKFAANIEPAFKVDKAKKQIEEIRKEYERLQKEVNKPLSPNNLPPKPTGNAPTSRPVGGSPKPGGSSGDAEERRRQARIDTANVARSRFQFQSGRFRNVGQEYIDSAALRANEVTRAFEAGEVSARRMNSVLTQELTKLRDIGKENTAQANHNYRLAKWRMEEMVRLGREKQKQNKADEVALKRQETILERSAERRRERLTDAALGLNPRMLAGGLGIAAAVEGVSRIVENLRSTAERINLTASGARNVQTNPNAIAAITAYGQANGIDSASIKKITDNIKDVRERIASSVMSATLNKKGQYTGGDSGVDQVMNTFGWNPSQIKKFQSDPLDFLQAIENEGQRRGMNSAQIGHLMENLGDDLMHYEPAFRNGGAEILKFTQMLVDSGANINDSTAEAAKSFMMLDARLGLVEQGLSNNFLVGFMNGYKENSDQFVQNVKNIDKAANWLGEELGDLATQVGVFVNSISGVMSWLKTQWPFNKMIDDTPTKTNPNSSETGNAGTSLLPQQPDADSRTVDQYLNATNGMSGMWSGLANFMDRIDNSSISWGGLNNHQFDFLSSAFNSTQDIGYQGNLPQLNANVSLPEGAVQVMVVPDGTAFSQLISASVVSEVQNQNTQTTLNILGATSTRN